MLELKNISKYYNAGTVNAVSYTHLDVYKRQSLHSVKSTNSRLRWPAKSAIGEISSKTSFRPSSLSLIHIFSYDRKSLRASGLEKLLDTRKTLCDISTGYTTTMESTHGQLCTRSVSYTHLDVYKRQIRYWSLRN